LKEKVIPSDKDKEEAVQRLKYWLDFEEKETEAAEKIRRVLEEFVPGIEAAYAAKLDMHAKFLADNAIPKLLVDMAGIELFQGDSGRLLRKYLLEQMLTKKLRSIRPLMISYRWNNFGENGIWDADVAKKAVDELNDSKKTHWVQGSLFARRFVERFGFSQIYVGIPTDPKPDRIEPAIPRTPYFNLKNFQLNMEKQVLSILKGDVPYSRAIVVLPTGAGKTKTVAEAILDFWKNRKKYGKEHTRFILWIAQTEELCEQAILCMKQIWEEVGDPGEHLNLFRAWGGKKLPDSDEEGIIIAGISQLHSSWRQSQRDEFEDASDLKRISQDEMLGAVFIDEAHRSWARSYRSILEPLGIHPAASLGSGTPLIGLTATPERTGDGETKKLLAMYGNERIFPNDNFEPRQDQDGNLFDKNWSSLRYMKEKLTELGILARPTYHNVSPGTKFVMEIDETAFFEEKQMFDKKFINKIGLDAKRNEKTYNVIKNWLDKKDRQVLFFGANLNQALLMSRFLEDDGIRSATITGNTRYGTRKSYIEMFRKNEIKVLCNYEVLTTGFDVPSIDTIIIARPTESVIVYQQMIGRGLRGPEFGGTPTCDIITVEDNIRKYNKEEIELGYVKYQKEIGDAVILRS